MTNFADPMCEVPHSLTNPKNKSHISISGKFIFNFSIFNCDKFTLLHPISLKMNEFYMGSSSFSYISVMENLLLSSIIALDYSMLYFVFSILTFYV